MLLDQVIIASFYPMHCFANCKIGVTPREILSKQRLDNSQCFLIDQDIYNLKKKLRRNRLDIYTPTQALLRALHSDRWLVKIVLRTETKKVKKLFFVHKGTTEILSKISEILIMNCTYKTNKYRMPLLIICEFTSLGTTFIVGFVFIEKKTTKYYD